MPKSEFRYLQPLSGFRGLGFRVSGRFRVRRPQTKGPLIVTDAKASELCSEMSAEQLGFQKPEALRIDFPRN